MLTVVDAANMLDEDPKNIRRYINQGKLEAKKVRINRAEFAYRIYKKSLENFILENESYSKLEQVIKEAYSLHMCGASLEMIEQSFNEWSAAMHIPKIKSSELEYAIQKYLKLRKIFLDRYSISDSDQEKIFTTQEACARLRITDYHCIYHLVEEGNLTNVKPEIEKCPFGNKMLVTVDSMRDMLGGDVTTRFYTSRHASMLTGKTVNMIDRLALQNGLGRKLKAGRKNSIYLFSYDELIEMKRLKMKFNWYNSRLK